MNELLEPPLPEPFQWVRIFKHDPTRTDVELRLGLTGELVATVSQMSGRWHTTLNLHLGSHQLASAFCASREQGMRWTTRWLEHRTGKILMEIGEQRIRLARLEADRVAARRDRD